MKRVIAGVLIIVMAVTSLGCTDGVAKETENKLVNWEENTHSDSVEPDYETVFNQSEVLEFNIEIDRDDWAAMQEDLEANIEPQKMEGERPRPDGEAGEATLDNIPQGERPMMPESQVGEVPLDHRPEENKQTPAIGQLDDISADSDYDPIWVESSITFDDATWDHVGIRFKGNSSLKSSVSSGSDKLSFKLDFDEFEDDYPEINNQRFYGFKQLNLNNNYADGSLMREKISSDLFGDFGLASAKTSFCIVNVDYGEGSQFLGVYTLVEEMDDTGIENQFGDDSGNLYKPDGTAASFASGTYNNDEMGKKNNDTEEDYSDVKALYDVINSEERERDIEGWKSNLEGIFNVDGFLKWLAANTVMQNWDTYGNMTHNYYLYHNPETNKLEWIPWDNNEALQDGKGNRGALSLGLDEVTDQWPLIYYLINDSEYKAVYDNYLKQFTEEVFTEEKMIESYNNYFDIIKDYAYQEEEASQSRQSFDSSVEEIKVHVVKRNEAVASYLAN